MKRHGIPVVHHLPGVGENLQDHLQIRMQYKVKNVKTLNGIANSLWGKAAMALEYFAFRTGPLTMPPSQAGAFAKSDPSQPTPNIEWHVQPLSLDKFGDPLHSFPAITPSVCNLRPASRGWVRIKSPNPADYPEIRLNYLQRRGGPQGGGRRHALHPAHHGEQGAGEVPAGGIPAWFCDSRTTKTWKRRPESSAPRSSTRWAPARWAKTPWRWWTTSCACTAFGGCG